MKTLRKITKTKHKKNVRKVKSNPNKSVVIYDRVIEIRAQKGKNSNYPGENFKHDFRKKSQVQVIGNPDGSVTLKSKSGKRLWKKFAQ